MKLSKILPLLPIIGVLAGCTQPMVPVPDASKTLSEAQTQAPVNFVVYPDDRPSIPDGKYVWETAEKGNCASCHGANGTGGSGPAMTDARAMAQKKPVDMYKAITFGAKPEHKMQDKLTNREIWNLVFYTRAISTAPLTTAEMEAIAPVFGSNCAVCHGTKGDGDGPLARNLEPMPANFQTFRRFYDRTDDTLFDHIANGIKWEGMPNFLGKKDVKKNVKFDHAYIKKLVLYVRNFHVSNESTMVAANTPAATSTTTAAPAATGSPDATTDTATSTAAPSSTDTSSSADPGAGGKTTNPTTGASTQAETPKDSAGDKTKQVVPGDTPNNKTPTQE